MTQQFCTECGAPLPSEGNFCPQCGSPIQRGAEPVPTAAAPPLHEIHVEKSRTNRRWGAWIAVALATLALLAFGVYWFGAQPSQSAAAPEPCVDGEECAANAIEDVHDENGIPFADVLRTSISEARALQEAGAVTIVDVRDAEAYASAHVVDSISLPLAEIEAGKVDLPKDARIITLCT